MEEKHETLRQIVPSEAAHEPEATQPARGGANVLKFLLGVAVGLTFVAALYFAFSGPITPITSAPPGPVELNIGQVTAMVPETSKNIGLGVGQEAPNFVWKDQSGKEVRLSDMRGKAVLLNFFATWCGPCRSETPDLQALYLEKQDAGLQLIFVDGDPKDTPKINEYAQNFRLSVPVLGDSQGLVAKRYQVDGYPVNYFIDRDGIIRDVFPGALSRNLALQKVTRLLQP